MSKYENMRGLVDAVTELKAEYGIGSSEAFAYLKCMRRYEASWEKMRRDHPEMVQVHGLTVKHVATLRNAMAMTFQYILNGLTIEQSTPEFMVLQTVHTFRDEILDSHESESDHELFQSQGMIEWSADYDECVTSFLCVLVNEGMPGLENATLFKMRDWLQGTLLLKAVTFTHFMTGEKLRLSGFVKNMSQYCQVDQPDQIWEIVDAILSFSDEDAEELNLFHSLKEGKDLKKAHGFLQKRAWEILVAKFQSNCVAVGDQLRSGSIYAENWLYGSDLYERAQRELTLGTYAVERRIALNWVHETMVECVNPDPAEVVHATILELKERLNSAIAKNLKARQGGFYPDALLDSMRKSEEKIRYEWLAVKQNQRWLIEFLSR